VTSPTLFDPGKPSRKPGDSTDDELAEGQLYKIGQAIGAVLVAVVMLATFAAVVTILVGAVFLAIAVFPDSVVAKTNPNWVDNIFDERWIIFAIRLGILGAGTAFLFFVLYVIGSIVYRMGKGHWLRSGGPFEAGIPAQVSHELGRVEPVVRALEEAEDRNRELAEQLEQSDELIQQLLAEIQEKEAEGDGAE
jgi:hypothetical protein